MRCRWGRIDLAFGFGRERRGSDIACCSVSPAHCAGASLTCAKRFAAHCHGEADFEQLNVGGRVVAIIGEAPVMSAQIVTRNADNSYSTVHLFETNVKPLREATAHSHFKF